MEEKSLWLPVMPIEDQDMSVTSSMPADSGTQYQLEQIEINASHRTKYWKM